MDAARLLNISEEGFFGFIRIEYLLVEIGAIDQQYV